MPDTHSDNPRILGAEPVNDELEVGFNSDFEARWHRNEIIGRVILVIFVGAGLAGLLGSGPFSHRRSTFPDGRLAAIDFEPIARMDTPTQVTFHLRRSVAQPDADDTVRLMLSSNTVEPFGMQRSHPASGHQQASGGDVVMTVPVADSGDDLVRIIGKPTQFGPIRMFVQIDGGPRRSWSQFVLP